METAEKRVLELQKQPVLNVGELFSVSSTSVSLTSSGMASSGQSVSISQSSSNSASGGGASTAADKSEKAKSCKESELQVQKRRQDLAETEDFYLEVRKNSVFISSRAVARKGAGKL